MFIILYGRDRNNIYIYIHTVHAADRCVFDIILLLCVRHADDDDDSDAYNNDNNTPSTQLSFRSESVLVGEAKAILL